MSHPSFVFKDKLNLFYGLFNSKFLKNFPSRVEINVNIFKLLTNIKVT